ncbi:SRPBCC family protein [Streptosporangium sp. NPDC051022]|uniref:SRPBCC family protein n=1 Tax=Streptosporangium sp. NPDC051022 TaxID=3155752 RepID=UPI00344499FB
MIITKHIEIARPAHEAFRLMTALDKVARCLPGATVTGVEDGTYHGLLSARVGPITMTYTGTAKLVEVDEEALRLVLRASGKDRGGKGGADATFDIAVTPSGPDACTMAVSADIRLRGLAAQFGRGALDGIIDALIEQFTTNIAQLEAAPVARTTAGAGAGTGADATGAAVPNQGGVTSGVQAFHAGQDVQGRSQSTAGGQLDVVALAAAAIRPQLPGLIAGAVLGGVGAWLLASRRSRSAAGARPYGDGAVPVEDLLRLVRLLQHGLTPPPA